MMIYNTSSNLIWRKENNKNKKLAPITSGSQLPFP
jgi:hypothetical protein